MFILLDISYFVKIVVEQLPCIFYCLGSLLLVIIKYNF